MLLAISSITMGQVSDLSEKKNGVAPSRRSVFFSVFPQDREHMDLATGEIFENPRYAKIRQHAEKSISAVLEVHELTGDGGRTLGVMHYFEARPSDEEETDSSINFLVRIPSKDFSELVENLRHSVLPTSIVIDLEYDMFGEDRKFKFGWEPDGSGTQWDTTSEDGRQVEIGSVGFRYELLKEETDEETGAVIEAERATVPESIESEVKALGTQLAAIRADLRYAGVAAFVVIAILIFRGFHF